MVSIMHTYYQQQIIIQMFKNKSSNGGLSQEVKVPPRPKPAFTTDFIDREKYKLTPAQMIQKKASLQSKHRQEAIEELQERRKKLQQGIIDEDTRKVYETALTSKNIDINPPVRKNLSQMIRYEREQKEQLSNSRQKPKRPREDYEYKNEEESDQEGQQEVERQLKDTRDFIKKFQRAKKMDNIERAVEVLTDPVTLPKKKKTVAETSPKSSPLHNQKVLAELKDHNKSKAIESQEEALSCIEDTIRFMEERLFSSKRIEMIKQEQAERMKESSISNIEEMPKQTRKNQRYEALQLSGLGYHESDAEQQCMQTIRRMKQMMESSERPSPLKMKENCEYSSNYSPKFQGLSTLQKVVPNNHIAESEAEVDFSLTINSSDPSFRVGMDNEEHEYQKIKKSLFDEVNKLQLHTPEPSVIEPSFSVKESLPMEYSHMPIDQSSIPNIRSTPTPKTKSRKVNPDLARLKNQINGVKDSVEAIRVEPMPIVRGGDVMGVDFRGSISIKKHLIQK